METGRSFCQVPLYHQNEGFRLFSGDTSTPMDITLTYAFALIIVTGAMKGRSIKNNSLSTLL